MHINNIYICYASILGCDFVVSLYFVVFRCIYVFMPNKRPVFFFVLCIFFIRAHMYTYTYGYASIYLHTPSCSIWEFYLLTDLFSNCVALKKKRHKTWSKNKEISFSRVEALSPRSIEEFLGVFSAYEEKVVRIRTLRLKRYFSFRSQRVNLVHM